MTKCKNWLNVGHVLTLHFWSSLSYVTSSRSVSPAHLRSHIPAFMPFYGRVVFLWVQPNCADLQSECPAGSDHRKRRETGLMHALHTKQFTRKEKYQNTVNEIIDAFNSMTMSFNSSMRRCNIHELIFWSCLTAIEEPKSRMYAHRSLECAGAFFS